MFMTLVLLVTHLACVFGGMLLCQGAHAAEKHST
jgi:hypothetical protein